MAYLGANKMHDRLLRVPEAAHRLGVREKTIRRWIFLRKLTYLKVGRAVRISERQIERIIQRGTVRRRS